MARITGKNARIYLDKYDLSGRLSEGTLNLAPAVHDVTCFSDAADTFLEGRCGWSLDASGFFDAASGEIDEALQGLIGSGADRVGFFPDGDASGNKGYEGDAIQITYEIPIEAQGVCVVNTSFQGDDKPYRVSILHKATVTGAGNGSSRNMGTYDSEQGNLSYTTENSDYTFTDDGQDFADWEAKEGRRYTLIVTNNDTTITWAYLGPKVSATEIKVYQDATLSTTGWNGAGAGGKTPSSYTIHDAAGEATLRVVSFSGTNFTVELEDSTTGSFGGEETSLVTFTQATGTTEETKATVAPLRYVRATWTGTFTSVAFIVTHGNCII